MAEHTEATPIIKKVVKKGHGGHHGGAWKVAYADFVTAMMALFIVLWLVGQSKQTKEAISEYFRDPGVFPTTSIGSKKGAPLAPDQQDEPLTPPEPVPAFIRLQEQLLRNAGEQLATQLANMPDLRRLKDQVSIEITEEGLLIDLLDKEGSSFFEVGSAQFSKEAVAIVSAIAKELQTLPNPVVVEGHTDSRPFASTSYRSNWELSTDRAHSARRLLESSQIRSDQVVQVRGYADRKPRYPDQPLDVRNRRVSIAVLYNNSSGTPGSPASPTSHGPSGSPGGSGSFNIFNGLNGSR